MKYMQIINRIPVLRSTKENINWVDIQSTTFIISRLVTYRLFPPRHSKWNEQNNTAFILIA